MGAPAVRFGPSRERTREGGSRLGALRGGEGEGVQWCGTRSSRGPGGRQRQGRASVGKAGTTGGRGVWMGENATRTGRLLGWLFWAGPMNKSLCELFTKKFKQV
jgi:hypothetical protein